MPPRKQTPANAPTKPIEEKVVDWLGEQGYRLEIMTHKALKNQGLSAALSVFLESEEGMPREVDVLAWADTGDKKGNVSAQAVCECKYSQKPWVLIYSDSRPAAGSLLDLLPHSYFVSPGPNLRQNARLIESLWHFSRDTEVAYALLEAMKEKNQDVAYDALRQITGAAQVLAHPKDEADMDQHTIVIPCIVVDGPLLRATFNHDTSSFEASRIQFGRVLFSGSGEGTLVDVVQFGSLGEYARILRATLENLARLLSAKRDD